MIDLQHTCRTAPSDLQLVAEALHGRTESFGELVRRYQNRVYNIIVHIIGSPDEAEDVVQEIFLLALKRLTTFAGRSTFYTWLYRLSVNRAISYRRCRRPVLTSQLPVENRAPEPVDPSEPPITHLIRAEDQELVALAFQRLNHDDRTILVLREIEELKYSAIAEVLGIQEGTVRSRIHRARVRLRNIATALS